MLPTAANAAVQVAIPKPATPQANMQYNKTIPIYYPRNKTENIVLFEECGAIGCGHVPF